jgi:hypothetical protein
LIKAEKVSDYLKVKVLKNNAKVAHLVEHDLAKVGVAGSSPVFRSDKIPSERMEFFLVHPGGGTGRHAGLKILFSATRVWVQLPSRVHIQLLMPCNQ